MGFEQLAQLSDRLRAGKEQELSGTMGGNWPRAGLRDGLLLATAGRIQIIELVPHGWAPV